MFHHRGLCELDIVDFHSVMSILEQFKEAITKLKQIRVAMGHGFGERKERDLSPRVIMIIRIMGLLSI